MIGRVGRHEPQFRNEWALLGQFIESSSAWRNEKNAPALAGGAFQRAVANEGDQNDARAPIENVRAFVLANGLFFIGTFTCLATGPRRSFGNMTTFQLISPLAANVHKFQAHFPERIFRSVFSVDYILALLDSQGMNRKRDDALAQAFATLIRELRTELGLSQEQLAIRAGVDRTFVSKLELKKHQPSLPKIFSLAYAVGKTPEDLIAEVRRRLATTIE